MTAGEPLGLIAGNGRFPFLVAAAARRAGRRVVAVGIREEAAPELVGEVDELHWVGLGQLGRCIEVLRAAHAREAVMAGQVKHRQLFSGIVPDVKLMGLLARLALKNTDSLIGGVADVLAREGITLLPSVTFLGDQLARPGAMTRRSPSRAELKDVEYGREVAATLARMDVGQTVVVKDRAAVALEAMEGTDEVVRRAGRIAGPGATVVKVAKPRQDMRFDVPVVGTGTIEVMREAGARTLAVDAGKTLLIDKPEFLARADARDIAVWGMDPEGGGVDEHAGPIASQHLPSPLRGGGIGRGGRRRRGADRVPALSLPPTWGRHREGGSMKTRAGRIPALSLPPTWGRDREGGSMND